MVSSGKIAGGGGLGALVVVLVAIMALGPGCTQLGLKTASRSLEGAPQDLQPVLGSFGNDGPIVDVVDWAERRETLQQAFAQNLYGPYPEGVEGVLISREVLDTDFAKGAGQLEELTVRLGEGAEAVRFRIALALPDGVGAETPAPLILAENFCGNRLAMDRDVVSPPLGDAGGCWDNPVAGMLVKLIFGKHIATPPLENILKRGYAIAEVFPSEVAPDNKSRAPAALERLGHWTTPGTEPEGVLAVWAATFGWAIDALEDDPRIDTGKIVAWGHSRHAKSALLAAAHDGRIAGVIAHQSGTGGATLSASENGESIKQITGAYPHWFSPIYAEYAGRETELPVEQHQLLALIAPRPLFLGNGWKDVWSDPNGSFRAARAADPAWTFLGAEGLTQTGLADPDYLTGKIAFQIRSGAHGVREADWRAFLNWMDRWFPSTIETSSMGEGGQQQ